MLDLMQDLIALDNFSGMHMHARDVLHWKFWVIFTRGASRWPPTRKLIGTMKMASLMRHSGGTVWGMMPVMTTVMTASRLNTMYMEQ